MSNADATPHDTAHLNHGPLRDLLRQRLLEEILRSPTRKRRRRPTRQDEHHRLLDADLSYEWAVLVVDSYTLALLRCCFRPYELTSENIARVDKVDMEEGETSVATPTALHAIYFLSTVGEKAYY